VGSHLHIVDRLRLHDLSDISVPLDVGAAACAVRQPQVFGVVMIVIGLTALVLAWLQHRQGMNKLQADFGPMPYSIAGLIAAMIAGLGLIALIGVTLRL